MNCTKNHSCSNCGQCCMPILPITFEEYHTIKDYIKDNHVEAVPSLVGNDFHIDCPFHDYNNNKCNIYPVRPEVCRNFLCSHTEKRINTTLSLDLEGTVDVGRRRPVDNAGA